MISLYENLLLRYGYQGWWPLSGIGYHPKDYSFPKNPNQIYEIAIGAILTQNTSWKNVEKAMANLAKKGPISPEMISFLDDSRLKELIRPAGFFNQKARYIRNFTDFFANNKRIPTREELLSIKGIGKETADSILLYAYKMPIFVVDTYTKRLLKSMGITDSNNYDEIRMLIESKLPKDFRIYQEFHALIVEHNKRINHEKQR